MSNKVGDLAIKVGEYEKDGETKGRYVNVGVLLEGDNGMYALLDPTVNLAGALVCQRLMNPKKSGDRVMTSVFTERSSQRKSAPPAKDFDDDVPW